MIRRTTATALGLKPMTRSMCRNFFVKINTEFDSQEAIREAISWWQDDKERLNRLWWVLNYYSEQLDPDRALRACVEKQLNSLAGDGQSCPDSDPDAR
ncbi:MAG: hypothetical protein HUN04_13835 [Desulfobacter sp.]|nr:MAG: hypothetical protein HUN04_13835 [Desulfobacter sp.]